MKRFVEGDDRKQVALLPECVDDYIGQDNPVRVIDVFVDELELEDLGFSGTVPALTGRPSYYPGVMLKIYIYGYLNRVPSSRRLERECQRNVELMWLTGRLAPDFKTIADFRRDNGPAIRNVCRRFVELCRGLKLLFCDMVAIDGSRFKAVNSRDKNYTTGKIDKRRQQIEESVQRYLGAIETADRTSPTGFDVKTLADRGYFSGPEIRACDLNDISAYVPKPLTSASRKKGLFTKADFVYAAKDDVYRCPAGERAIHRFNTVENGMNLRVYWPSACPRCPMKQRCSPSDYRRIRRWEHEAVLEAMQRRLDRKPDAMTIRRSTVEHVFGTLKHWMGPAHFLTRTLGRVSTEMSLQVLAYNLRRVVNILGATEAMKAIKMAAS
ncbi:transposase [Paraburkholderia youngii]|uniref:transposase n=1 Tax=Paraburkholderia youngii TaxID=2782701 RepID=UPI003D194B54